MGTRKVAPKTIEKEAKQEIKQDVMWATESPDDYVRVHRLDDVLKQWTFHGRLAPEEATEEKLAKLFGGGSYRLTLWGRNEEGKFQYRAIKSVRLPGPYRPPRELPGTNDEADDADDAPARGTTPQVGTASNAMDVLNAGMVATVMDLLKASREQMAGRGESALTPLLIEMMTRQAEQQTQLLTALLTNRDGGTSARDEWLQLFREAREMVAPRPQDNPTNPSNIMREFLAAMREFRDASDELGGSRAADADPMAASMVKLIDLLQRGASGQLPAPRPGTPTAPAGAAPAAPAQPAAPQDTRPWAVLLRRYAGVLARWAQAGLDPQWAAETVLNLSPGEFQLPPLTVDDLVQVAPVLTPWRDWLDQFLSEIYMLAAGESGDVSDGDDDDPLTGEEVEPDPPTPPIVTPAPARRPSPSAD